jgi:hypothetical protein
MQTFFYDVPVLKLLGRYALPCVRPSVVAIFSSHRWYVLTTLPAFHELSERD